MILITAASGNIGKELSKLLAQSNTQARAMCRTEEEFEQFTKIGLEAVIGDFNDPASLEKAMQGCDRMFLLVPAVREQSKNYKSAIDAALAAGVKYMVKLSTGDCNLDSHIAWAKASAESDHYLRSKPIDWTILRPTGFMLNMLEAKAMISKGILPNPTDNGKVAWIDHRDIALVAKHILTSTHHKKAIYYLTGPEALSTNDLAGLFTRILGFPVKSTLASLDDMRKNLEHAGLEEWQVSSFIAQYEMVKNGLVVDVTEDVERVTGQEPRTFAGFIQEFKSDFLAE